MPIAAESVVVQMVVAIHAQTSARQENNAIYLHANAKHWQILEKLVPTIRALTAMHLTANQFLIALVNTN